MDESIAKTEGQSDSDANLERLVVEKLPASIKNHIAIIHVESYEIISLNPAGRKLLGIEETEDVTGWDWRQFIADDPLKSDLGSGIEEAIVSGNWRQEGKLHSISGKEFPAFVLVTAAATLECGARAIAIIARDISKEKQQEKERQQLELSLNLARKMESIGKLAAGVAHEINSPAQYVTSNIHFIRDAFSKIQNSLDFLKSKVDLEAFEASDLPELLGDKEEFDFLLEDVEACFEQTIDGLLKMTQIVTSLKEFSHPGSKDKRLADINRSIKSAIAVSRHEWIVVAEVETEFEEEALEADCYIDELNQVFLNLIVNAAHAIETVREKNSSHQGKISIHSRKEDSYAIIEISDNGIGIPQELLDKIFEHFFTTKEVGKGSGQGLAITRSVIEERHKGKVEVSSERGTGTKFLIQIPLNTAPNNE